MKSALASLLRGLSSAVIEMRVSIAKILLGNLSLPRNPQQPQDPAEQLGAKLRDPGLDCPKCGTLIRIDVARLLSLAPIICPNPNCRLVLAVDLSKSGESLQAL